MGSAFFSCSPRAIDVTHRRTGAPAVSFLHLGSATPAPQCLQLAYNGSVSSEWPMSSWTCARQLWTSSTKAATFDVAAEAAFEASAGGS